MFTVILTITIQIKVVKKLIVFHNMIEDINTNKNVQSMVKEQFIRHRKLKISLAFITQFYSPVSKDTGLNTKH